MDNRTKVCPLLCELHAHTTWSDGEYTLPALIDLYGNRGFDVLCVTDHVLDPQDPCSGNHRYLDEGNFGSYLLAIEEEAERALGCYGMLLLPGLELTINNVEPDEAIHTVAVGLREFITVDGGMERSLQEARAAGAGLIAAHPHGDDWPATPIRTTRGFWKRRESLADLVDRVELFNQQEFYGWVVSERLPAVANGDFHRYEHLASWKTLLPCEKRETAVVAYLRSKRPAYLTRLEEAPLSARAAA